MRSRCRMRITMIMAMMHRAQDTHNQEMQDYKDQVGTLKNAVGDLEGQVSRSQEVVVGTEQNLKRVQEGFVEESARRHEAERMLVNGQMHVQEACADERYKLIVQEGSAARQVREVEIAADP